MAGYSGTAAARLWRVGPSRPLFGILVILAFASGGCSFSYKLDSWIGKDEEKTGSARASVSTLSKRASGEDLPPEPDLLYAKAAVHEVLARGDAETSLPWENPVSGARGTVTPLTSAYSHDGFHCRDFLASYVRGGTESWLQGEACRVHQGKWEVKNMRPWKRT
jgi:surface antigen